MVTIQEIATLTGQAGFPLGGPRKLGDKFQARFQVLMAKNQITQEKYFEEIISILDEPTLLVCDRGVLDIFGFIPKKCHHAVLEENGWNLESLVKGRYDAVIHLVTAAEGAEDFYNSEGNSLRTETPEQSRAIDNELGDVYIKSKCPYYRVENGPGGFSEKMENLLEIVKKVINEKMESQDRQEERL